MSYDGTLKFDTSLDASGMQKGADRLGDILKGLGVFEILKKGVQMVADSVQAAMGRLDTMDQFNRVMTTMTGSADKANAALEKTNAIVSGTAFGLDTAAKGVQAFVASGMEVSRATDTMGAWADAVAFYTKGTNSELDTVSTALQKMGTKGNVTMEHLQMLLEAGIPAVQIYANAVGVSTAEVTEQMSKGQLKTADFINVMNKAFQTGTAGFPAVAGAAKEAGSSWGGSIDNMKAAITRGTASILTSFDKMFNVKAGMVSFGKAVEGVLKGIAKNMDIIAPVTLTAVGAFVAYKAALGISSLVSSVSKAHAAFTAVLAFQNGTAVTLTATQMAQNTVLTALKAGNIAAAASTGGLTAAQTVQTAIAGVLSGQITFATAVQYLWNAAMEANPIGAIIALVALLVTGIVALVTALSRGSEAYQEQKEKIDALNDAHDELETKIDESAEAYRKEQAELIGTGQAAQQAIDKLSQYGDGSLSAAADNRVLESALQKLNDTYENINVTQEEFEKDPEGTIKRVQAYKDLAQSVQKYETYLGRVNTVEDENAQAQAGLLQVEIQRKEIAQQLKDGTLAWYEAGKLAQDLYWTEKDYNDTLKETQDQLDALAKVAEDSAYRQEVAAKNKADALNGATDSEGRNLKKIAQEWGLTEEEILGAMDSTGKNLGEWVDDNKKYYSSDGKNIEQIARKWGTTSGKVKAWIDRMGSDVDGYIEYNKSKLTESGMDVLMLAKKWGMSVGQIDSYCQEWGLNYNEFNEEMKATHTDAGLSIEQLAVKWGTTTDAIKEQMAMQEIDLQTWSDNQDKTLEEWNAAVKENTDLIINDFQKLPTSMDYSLNDMIRIMNDNADKYDAWRGKMAQVSSKLTPEVLGYLQQLGPGTSDILDEVIKDTTGQKAAEINAAFARVGSSAVEGAKSKVPEVEAAGAEFSGQYGAAMAASTAPNEASQQIAAGVVQNLTDADYSGITTGIAAAIKAGVGSISSAIGSMATSVQAGFNNMKLKAVNTANEMMTAISAKIAAGRSAATAAANTVVLAVMTPLNTLNTKARTAISMAMSAIQVGLGSTSGVAGAAANIVDTIVLKLDDLPGRAKSVIRSMFDGMKVAMDDYAPSLYTKARTIANGIISIMKTAFDIHSPSRVMFGIFKNLMLGGINAMQDGMKKLFALTDEISGGMQMQLAGIPSSVLVDMSGQMRSAITGTKSDIARGMSVSINAAGAKLTASPQSNPVNVSMPITVNGKMTETEINAMSDKMFYTVRKKLGRLYND